MAKSKRKGLKPSLRWSVFYRDGFACRYCGAQAGEDGVELVVDHVVSVADGGDNGMDNLATSCRKCNSGKGAKSISDPPVTADILDRVRGKLEKLSQLRSHIQETIEARNGIAQQIINLKCAAYEMDSVRMANNEENIALALVKEFGAGKVLEWYSSAYWHGVPESRAIKYVCGCARNERGGGD